MNKITSKFYDKLIKDYDFLYKSNSTFEEFHTYNLDFLNDCDIQSLNQRYYEYFQDAIKQLKIFNIRNHILYKSLCDLENIVAEFFIIQQFTKIENEENEVKKISYNFK